MNRDCIKKIIISVLLILVIFSMIFIRVYIGSMEAYKQGKSLFQKQEYIRATTYFDRSIHWYIPFNKYIYQSAEYLWKIHLYADNKEDLLLSLIALQAIRSGFYSSLNFYQPGKEWIKKCDAAILALKESQGKNILPNRKDLFSPSIVPDENRNKVPILKWTVILDIGLLGWIGAVILSVFFLSGKINRRPFMLFFFSSLITILFYGLWVLGMMKA